MKCIFTNGDRVVVQSDCNSKGMHGIVKSTQWVDVFYGKGHYLVTVLLDDIYDNVHSKNYNENSLKLEREDDYMSFIGTNGIVNVEMCDSSRSLNLAAYETYEIGDVVVCSTKDGIKIGKVKEVFTLEKCKKVNKQPVNQEVICKVDMVSFEERKIKREKIAKLKREMDAIVLEQQKSQLYEMMAENNPILAEKLAEYKELIK